MKPKTKHELMLLRLEDRYGTDETACKSFLRILGLSSFRCPSCGHRKYHVIARRNLRQCERCRHQQSFTAGTVFHNTRVPLPTWAFFLFMYTLPSDHLYLPILMKHGSISKRQYQRWKRRFDDGGPMVDELLAEFVRDLRRE